MQSDEILYSRDNNVEFIGYTNSDWGDDIETKKSTSGFAFYLGSCVSSWFSKK